MAYQAKIKELTEKLAIAEKEKAELAKQWDLYARAGDDKNLDKVEAAQQLNRRAIVRTAALLEEANDAQREHAKAQFDAANTARAEAITEQEKSAIDRLKRAQLEADALAATLTELKGIVAGIWELSARQNQAGAAVPNMQPMPVFNTPKIDFEDALLMAADFEQRLSMARRAESF